MEFGGVKFCLSEAFVNKFKRKHVAWGPLGEFVYLRTYSRTLDNGKQERWWQTVCRVVEGVYLIQKRHCLSLQLPWNERQAQRSAQKMYELIFDFKFLPPGRGLWAMGTEYVFQRGSAALQNCGVCSTERISDDFSSPFVWAMDMSLHGVGIGFDVLGANKKIHLKNPKTSIEVHTVEDSREGWVAAWKRVLDAYVRADVLPSAFDYSQIRPAGSPIRGFGGIAPGSAPLEQLIERTNKLLSAYVAEDRPVDATLIVDLFTFAGAAVVAGGQRRSSLLALGSSQNEEFLDLKAAGKVEDPDLARWASNNSIVGQIGMDYRDVADRAAMNGEPGVIWLENCRHYGRMKDPENSLDLNVVCNNPCSEQNLWDRECCTLVETFPVKHDSLEEYKTTLKYAYLYGKTVTLLPGHHPETNAVMMRNRRIGTSQTGVIENIQKLGFREHIRWCDEGYGELKKWDTIYSDWLCVPRSIKLSTVKPSGCQVPSTLINTQGGIFRLDELGDTSGAKWQEITYKTTEDKEVTKFFVNGCVKTKKIWTEDGNYLESSLQHRYMVWTDGQQVWRRADELKPGDYLVTNIGDYTKEVEPELVQVDAAYHNCRTIKHPILFQ